MPFRLNKGRALDKDLKRIAREQIDIMLKRIDDESVPLDKKVHGARLRCKRLRALLRLLRPMPGKRFRTEDRRLRRAARRLCHLRDAHVLEQTLSRLTDDRALRREAAGKPDVQTARALQRARRDMRHARDSIKSWEIDDIRMYDICAGHGHTYERAVDAWHACLADPSDERFHRLRRWAKYLYYQTCILRPINPKQLGRQRKRLNVMEELIGDGHDLAVLEHALAAAGETDQALIERAAKEKEACYDEALALCESVFTKRPARYVADLAGWWADWR